MLQNKFQKCWKLFSLITCAHFSMYGSIEELYDEFLHMFTTYNSIELSPIHLI